MKLLYTYPMALFASLTAALALLLAPAASAASSATLTLTPATGSYTVGSTFTVAVQENSQSAAINAVQANLTYNQSDLQFVSISSNGSAFDVDATSTGGSGQVSIARAKLQTSLTGDQTVASITFKVLADSGSSAISFASTSAIVQTSDHQSIWDGDTKAGTYSYTASGTAVQSSGTASAPQNSVAIKVVTPNNQPVANAKVTLNGTTVSTDSTGVASFPNVNPGQDTVAISTNGQTSSQPITVKPQTPKALQQFNVRLANSGHKTSVAWYIAALLVALAAGVGVVRLLHRPPTTGAKQ